MYGISAPLSETASLAFSARVHIYLALIFILSLKCRVRFELSVVWQITLVIILHYRFIHWEIYSSDTAFKVPILKPHQVFLTIS